MSEPTEATNRPAFEVEKIMDAPFVKLPQLQPGCTIAVKFDPEDTQKLEIVLR